MFSSLEIDWRGNYYLPEQKADAKQIKLALRIAFALDHFLAYEQFMEWQLCLDKSVNMFLADMKKLAGLFVEISKQGLAYAFIAGLPAHVKPYLPCWKT